MADLVALTDREIAARLGKLPIPTSTSAGARCG
jgi:hypothetical protein